jgi:hypothetical protein
MNSNSGVPMANSSSFIDSPLSMLPKCGGEIKNMDFKQAWEEIRDAFNNPCLVKAIKFASENPRVVYGKRTPEYDAVRHGFFDLYLSVSLSNASVDGA